LLFHPNKRAFTLGLASAFALGGLAGCGTKPVTRIAPGAAGDQPDGVHDGVPFVGGEEPPAAPREFRAAWVSTVANIDWPSKPGLNSAQQQAEAIAILDRARAMNLNAIVLQVRPTADGIYPSKLEPWTEYLSGVQGKAPQPWYDPLKFWIDAAHARGLELHAWFNPYRARMDATRTQTAPNHISNTNPAIVKRYGKFLWMDPGEPAAVKQTMDVILDVVRRYDIDGVHIDDYFYPYPIEATPTVAGNAAALEGRAVKGELDFPDDPAWRRYLTEGGQLDRADWRRDNVNRLIEAMYKGIHAEKSWVRFGVSPFGIGRPDRRPPGIHGFSQYDKLYADAELWLEKGWLDYFVPQLYWAIKPPGQAYDVLLDYWIAQNPQGRHIWPGLFTSRIGAATRAFEPDEIVQQVSVTRSRPRATGHVHFSMVALMQNRKGVADQLRATRYTTQALVPATPWLSTARPGTPLVDAARRAKSVDLRLKAGAANAQYAVWSRHGGVWRFAVVPALRVDWSVPDDPQLGAAEVVVVNAVDRLGNEGARVRVWPKRASG